MVWVVHSKWLERHDDGTDPLDLDSTLGGAVIKLGIVTNAVINPDTDTLFATLTAVATNIGWTGPITLLNLSSALDGSFDLVFDADDVAQIATDAGGFTDGRSLVLFESVNDHILAHSTEPIVFGNTTGPITITFSVSGIWKKTI